MITAKCIQFAIIKKLIYYIIYHRFDEEIHGDEGDYKLCFSNYMSTWSEKYVWFEASIFMPTHEIESSFVGIIFL